jgi:hypothetical protein
MEAAADCAAAAFWAATRRKDGKAKAIFAKRNERFRDVGLKSLK